MKKTLFVLFMLLCLSAIFAANNVVSFGVHPYSAQLVDNYGWGNKYYSSLGWGAKVGYRHHFGSYLLGCDLTYNGYTYKEYTHGAIATYQLVPKVGGKIHLSDELEVNFDIGLGLEVDVSTSVDATPVLSGSAALAFYFGPAFALTAGMDMSLSYQESGKSSFLSRTWSVSPSVGAEYDF